MTLKTSGEAKRVFAALAHYLYRHITRRGWSRADLASEKATQLSRG
jgi:hypothetical protein